MGNLRLGNKYFHLGTEVHGSGLLNPDHQHHLAIYVQLIHASPQNVWGQLGSRQQDMLEDRSLAEEFADSKGGIFVLSENKIWALRLGGQSMGPLAFMVFHPSRWLPEETLLRKIEE